MRALMASALVALAFVGSACANPPNCDACPGPIRVNVVLTDADSGTVVPMGFSQRLGVELQGSGRTISITDPSRMQSWMPLQPSGETVALFAPTYSGTGTRTNQLLSYGGSEVLTAPALGSHAAWQATVVVTADPFSDSTVIAVGQSWVAAWWVGGVGPRSSDASRLALRGTPVRVRGATEDQATAGFVFDRDWELQMLVAVAPGTAVVSAPSDSPLATNQTTVGREYIVTNVPGWICSPTDGCRQTVLGPPNRPDRA